MKNIVQYASSFLVGLFLLQSCEPESDRLGEQLITPVKANADSMRLVAYNINNNDTIRSDVFTNKVGVLGAFTEPVFGMQKAHHVSQVRMAAYDFDFGANAAVDSVVLVLKPSVVTTSESSTTNDNYTYPVGNVAAKKVVKTYSVNKYGNATVNGQPANLTLNVHEVLDFLESPATTYMSNKQVNVNPSPLGSTVFKGAVSAVTITDKSTNAELYKQDATIRIPLDKGFFQTKILAKKGAVELKDVANFIRYFRGIRISVVENDGYLMQFDPNDASIIMYYKRDVVNNGTTTRPQTTFLFPLIGQDSYGNYYNSKIGQYEYNRTGTPLAGQMAAINTVNGDPKLYLQGMGGPSAAIKISAAQVQALKDKFKNQHAAILGAKIRLYTDTNSWNNAYEKPTQLSLISWPDKTFLLDQQAYLSQIASSFFSAHKLDKNPAYYEFNITRTLKTAVENADPAKDLIFRVDMGDYSMGPQGLLGFAYNTRSFTRDRAVLVGTDIDNPNAVKLQVVYSNQ